MSFIAMDIDQTAVLPLTGQAQVIAPGQGGQVSVGGVSHFTKSGSRAECPTMIFCNFKN